ncbi:DCL family protein [Bacillus sp. NP157]|nr:DCL family protein [Bacillus sp. NP157]
MAYEIGEEVFATKAEITTRCQKILHASSFGVADDDAVFLLGLFQHHDEWAEKSRGGVEGVRVYKTPHGTPCFNLVCTDGRIVDISFPHAIKCLPSNRNTKRRPQWLTDYKAAARQTIQPQIFEFRDREVPLTAACPVTGMPLTAINAHVDHVAPLTFDQLLRDFTEINGIDPSVVRVGSHGGTIAFFEDPDVASRWAAYHREHAQLRVISQAGNLGLPKPRVAWDFQEI